MTPTMADVALTPQEGSSVKVTMTAQKFTLLHRNAMLGTSRYIGTYVTQYDAEAYAKQEASRSRSFASWEVWTGTPDHPGKAIEGTLIKGDK